MLANGNGLASNQDGPWKYQTRNARGYPAVGQESQTSSWILHHRTEQKKKMYKYWDELEPKLQRNVAERILKVHKQYK